MMPKNLVLIIQEHAMEWRKLFFVVGLVCVTSTVAADDVVDTMMEEQLDAELSNVQGQQIIYIGTNEYPLKNADVAVSAGISLGTYNLDAQHNLENHLVKGLPTVPGKMNIEDAERIVEQRFNALSQADIMSIFQPVLLVERWDIRKAPAFVFGNGEAVIYGISDAAVAINIWQEWRREGGGW